MIYLFIFIVSTILSAPYIIDICSGYLSHQSFDLHEFLLWNYTAINNVLPYKEIFYPYGILNYFRNYNLLYAVISYLLSPLLFTVIFFLFKKIFKDKLILYTSFTLFFLFTFFLVGIQTFARYGLLVILPLYFSYVLYSSKKIKINSLIFSGTILGLVCSFAIDQGIYLITSFALLFLIVKGFKIKEALKLVLVFIVGLMPVFIFLLRVGDLNILFNYSNNIKEIVTVAKVPFFSFIDSPANIFTIAILYISIFYNFIKIFLLKNKVSLMSVFQISLILSILIMEQKSIVRSIDRQIVFASLILLMFLVYEAINYLKVKVLHNKAIYLVIISIPIIIYGLNTVKYSFNFSNITKNYEFLINNKCFDNNINYFLEKNPSYSKVISLLKKQKNFNGKVFSFPTGDSTFYALLNQKPPYYNAIFEGASYEKQNSAIKYINDNEVEYITLNTSKLSLQDAVPDYVRQNDLFRYILNNYQPLEIIGDHIILRKTQNNDFFTSKILEQIKAYENYLLNVYLYKIPYSEGMYKYNYLKNNNKLIVKGDADKVSNFLAKNKLVSRDKIIVLIPNKSNKTESLSFVKLKTENEHSTTIYYNSCHGNEACIINLSRIPLFYEDRLITKLSLDEQYSGKIEIFNVENPGNLW